MVKKRIRINKFGQKLFYPEDKCNYCGRPLGPEYDQFTFKGDVAYHCMDWGPTCRDLYEELQESKKINARKRRIIEYRALNVGD